MRHLSPQIRAALFKAASGSNWTGRIQAISRHEECVPFIADNLKYLITFLSPAAALTTSGEIDWRFRDKDGGIFLPELQHRLVAIWANCDDSAGGMREICEASAAAPSQAVLGSFGKMLIRAFKTYWYTNSAVDQYFFDERLPIADDLNHCGNSASPSAEADIRLVRIQELAAPHIGFAVERKANRQLTYIDGITHFTINFDVAPVDTLMHLYANGNQQVTIRVDIRKTRQHDNGTEENIPLSYAEIYSLRLREQGSWLDTPIPQGWAVTRTKDERFDQGVRPASHVHQQAQYPQRSAEVAATPAEDGIESIYFYVTTSEVAVRAFIAEITIPDIGTINTNIGAWGGPATQVAIQSAPPRPLQLDDFDTDQEELLNGKVNEQEGTWRWLRMTHFRIKPDSVQMESLDISNVPYYGTAAYRTFARGETQIAAIVAGRTTSVITTLIRQGYVSYPSSYPQYWLFPATDISAFVYTDTDFNLAHFSTTSLLRLRDKVGTISNFHIHLGQENYPVLSAAA